MWPKDELTTNRIGVELTIPDIIVIVFPGFSQIFNFFCVIFWLTSNICIGDLRCHWAQPFVQVHQCWHLEVLQCGTHPPMVTGNLEERERCYFHISSLYWIIYLCTLLLYGYFGEAAAQKPKMEVWCSILHQQPSTTKKHGLRHIETTSGWNLMNGDEAAASRMALWKGDMQLRSSWPRRISWTRWNNEDGWNEEMMI